MNYRFGFKQTQMLLLIAALSLPIVATAATEKSHASSVTQQQKTISGVVMDAQFNEPIIGANVVVKGSTTGVITDIDGKFTLEVPSSSIIQISYIGFTTVEIPASKLNNATVNMTEDAGMLEELVVVGYGVQKKANLTGSVSSVKAEALAARPVSSVSAALAGQMPGVTSIQSSGAPGGQSGSITVRGKNSINAASPLVIVDGVPGSMDTIDPSDIESLTVLKDASSAAIYGVQAANGVILITTKQGKKGAKANVSYSGTVSWASPTTRPDYLGSGDYAMLYNESILNENPNGTLRFTEEDIQKYRDGSSPLTHSNTDWYEEIFNKTALEQLHHLSISGGTERTTYNASVGFTQQDGLVDQNRYQRFNGRMNLNSQITKWFAAGLNLSGYRGTSMDGWESSNGLLQYTNRLEPIYAPRDAEGEFAYDGKINPAAVMGRSGYRKNMNQQLNGTLHGTINFLPNLSVKGLFSVRNDFRNYDGFKTIVEYGSPIAAPIEPREGFEEYFQSNWYTSQVIANYNETWGNHSMALLGGFEQLEMIHKYTKATRKGGGNNELQESMNTLDASSQKNDDGGHQTARRSYFARGQYDFSDRYLFEANIRFDASSRFPADSRWGAFPAFSAGWRITEEDFMKNSSATWLSNLKLRLGWGQTGNEELKSDDIYPSIPTYGYESHMFNNSLYSTAYESRYVNNQLQWATVTNYDLGIEAGFLDNKVGFEFSGYKKITNDMLLYLPVQGVLGMGGPAQNAGSVENTGFDLSIFHNNQINKDFRYDVTLNLAFVHNEITDMKGTKSERPEHAKYWYVEGESIGSFYGYQADGLFASQEEVDKGPKLTGTEKPGDIRYKDLNGDGKIDLENDRQVIGVDFPSWTAGLSANLYYKQFDLSLLFQGAFDVEGYYSGEAAYAFFNGGKALERHLDRWTPENLDATYPRVTNSDQKNFVTSSYWLQDASYVRLKNITLGYALPKSILDKIKINRVKLFLTGENLFTFTGLDGIDPEAPADNRGAFYSNVKKVSIGLKIGF